MKAKLHIFHCHFCYNFLLSSTFTHSHYLHLPLILHWMLLFLGNTLISTFDGSHPSSSFPKSNPTFLWHQPLSLYVSLSPLPFHIISLFLICLWFYTTAKYPHLLSLLVSFLFLLYSHQTDIHHLPYLYSWTILFLISNHL